MRGAFLTVIWLISAVDASHYFIVSTPDKPEDLNCIAYKDASIFCSWKGAKRLAFGIPEKSPSLYHGRGYAIYYKVKGSNERYIYQFLDFTSQPDNLNYSPEIKITRLEYGVYYTVEVAAFNVREESNALSFDIATPPDPLGRKVTNVRVLKDDAIDLLWHTRLIRWDNPVDDSGIKGYRVKVERADSGAYVQDKNLIKGIHEKTVKFQNLERNVKYKFSVAILFIDEHSTVGLWSDPAFAFVKPQPPTDFPKNLTCEQVEGKKILCSWSKLDKENQGDGEVLSYHAEMHEADGSEIIENVETEAEKEQTAVFGKFDANVRRRFLVAAKNMFGTGPQSPFVYMTTEGEPNYPPLNITLSFIEEPGARFLRIKWVESPRDDTVGQYRGYYMEIRAGGRFSDYVREEGSWKRESKWNLAGTPAPRGKLFSVRVAAYNDVGIGPFSDPARIINMVECPTKCKTGWYFFDDKCYKVFKMGKHYDFNDVRNHCSDYDALLALPRSQGEATFMVGLTGLDKVGCAKPERILINMNKGRNPQNSNLLWDESGKLVTWTNWFQSQEKCRDGFVWSPPGLCHHILNNTMTYDEAKVACWDELSELATIEDPQRNSQLTTLLSSNPHEKMFLNEAWLNLQDENAEGHPHSELWVWKDRNGWPVTWTNFLRSGVNNNHSGEKNCVALNGMAGNLGFGKWSRQRCLAKKRVICKQPSTGCDDKIECTKEMCDTSKYGSIGVDKCSATCYKNSACDEGPKPGEWKAKNCAFLMKGWTGPNNCDDPNNQMGYMFFEKCEGEVPGVERRLDGAYDSYICVKSADID